MKIGDIVTRKSYNKDIIFRIVGFNIDSKNEKIAKTDQPFLVLEEGINFYHKNEYLQAVNEGFNACLDEITGETE